MCQFLLPIISFVSVCQSEEKSSKTAPKFVLKLHCLRVFDARSYSAAKVSFMGKFIFPAFQRCKKGFKTKNHNWAIYVNPVSVDATVKILGTRCTAGGYVWNPYFTQLADPLNADLYKQECGSDHPLRCYVGDLSGRMGPIDLGGKRSVFSDPNLPLEGDVSAVGRSIVIMEPDFGHNRFACANIEPDKDLIKYVNLRKSPNFIVSQFLDDVHEVMGIPEWFLTIDTRKTKPLHNSACIQLFLHFKGPMANTLEQDFSRLISTGRLDSPSIFIPGFVPSSTRKTKISYKLCGNENDRGKRPLNINSFSSQNKLVPSSFNFLTFLLFIMSVYW